MAREARMISKSGNYYVELKGEKLFVTEEDKTRFSEILNNCFETGKVYASYLEDGMIRLVVKEGGKSISMTMKSVTTIYARYFNRTHNRDGKLFTGRFKSEPLETKAELDECVRNLKTSAPAKKTEPKRAAKAAREKSMKKETAPEPKKEAPKIEPKKNLPSWLL